MKIVKILGADIYRDGGSYGFFFDADDGHWYEFYVKSRFFEGSEELYYPPVIYFEDCNSNKILKELSWSEAKEFIAPLHYDNPRFHELVQIVVNGGGARRSEHA